MHKIHEAAISIIESCQCSLCFSTLDLAAGVVTAIVAPGAFAAAIGFTPPGAGLAPAGGGEAPKMHVSFWKLNCKLPGGGPDGVEPETPKMHVSFLENEL
jgi:hypothetical protein